MCLSYHRTLPPISPRMPTFLPTLLVVGLFTRLSALALLGMTFVIQLFALPKAGWPVHILWSALAMVLIVRGGGVLSLDGSVHGAANDCQWGGLRRLMRLSHTGDKQVMPFFLSRSGNGCRTISDRKWPADTVDDLVQDTLISLHRKRASYDPTRPFLPWLAAIARYRWVDRLRQGYRHEARRYDYDDWPRTAMKKSSAHGSASIACFDLIPDRASSSDPLRQDRGSRIDEACARTGQSERWQR